MLKRTTRERSASYHERIFSDSADITLKRYRWHLLTKAEYDNSSLREIDHAFSNIFFPKKSIKRKIRLYAVSPIQQLLAPIIIKIIVHMNNIP